MTAPYRPIACGFHDTLLAKATLGTECEIVFDDEAGLRREVRDRIADVSTMGNEEFLTLASGVRMRLDMLISVDGEELPGRRAGGA